jgi:TonB family C-terminal domain/TonB family C-terminal domain
MPAPDISQDVLSGASGSAIAVQLQDVAATPFNYRLILLFLYLSGMIFLLFRAIRHFSSIFKTINKANINRQGPAKLIRASQFPASFSFFNYVFINPSVNENEAEEILNHEIVHVRQKHWFDLLLVEILRLIQWVNPFAWIYTRFIRLNHEYLADQAALQRSASPANYRAALMNQLFNSPVISLSNSFNYSLNKKRFDMMKKIITSPYRKVKVLIVIPVIAILFYAFATPEYHYLPQPLNTTNETSFATIEMPSPIQALKDIKGIVLKEDGSPFSGVQILVAGTKIRTETDASGNFTLANVPESTFVVFSYRGYLTQSLKPDFSKTMNIKLLKDPDYKEPINVTGYGNQRVPQTNIKINDSFNNMSNPLVIIDGVPGDKESLKKLNPNEIANISVRKDKSATEIYGEKGKDGVIIVTTQKEDPIVVIDDVISTKTRREALSEIGDQIGTMARLSEKEATEKYGEKGKSGAIVIMTRKRAAELGIKIPFRRSNPDDFPTFQGNGRGAFIDWVISQVKYPPEATAKEIHGRVHAEFTVETDGTVSNVRYTGSPDHLLGDALVKTIQSSPKWDPAKNPESNEPYTSSFTIKFELPDKVLLETEPFVVVEQMPMYPGGEGELLKFIAENTHYPDSAKIKNIQGRVIVRFVVTPEGNTDDISVLKGVHPLLDAEAVRVASMLSGFTPGYQGGTAVPVWYMIPITFTLK